MDSWENIEALLARLGQAGSELAQPITRALQARLRVLLAAPGEGATADAGFAQDPLETVDARLETRTSASGELSSAEKLERLALAVVDQLSVEQIASILGCQIEEVESRLQQETAPAGRGEQGGEQGGEHQAGQREDPLQEEDLIAGYRIVDELGQGGMGTVYEAVEVASGMPVALKVLRQRGSSRDRVRLWRREAQALARLSHPGIARLHRSGMDREGVPFLAMELVRGEQLMEWSLGEGRSTRERVEAMLQLARAVDAAHRTGVLHLDLKPANVMVQPDCALRVLDFGMARLRDPGDASVLSGERILQGTLPYLAPEQVDPSVGEIDTASDVHALGVVLYELLTGVRAFGYDPARPMATAQEILRENPAAPSKIVRGLDRELDGVVARAMAKRPSERYASAGELADDLERYLRGFPVLAQPSSVWYSLRKLVARHRRAAALVAGLLLILVTALFVTSAAWIEARRAGRAETQQLERAREGIAALRRLLSLTRPGASQEASAEMPVREWLGLAEARLLGEDPPGAWVESELRQALAGAFFARGMQRRSVPHYERALELARVFHPVPSQEVARALRDLALAYHATGDLSRAEGVFRDSLAMFEQLAAPADEEVVRARALLAELFVALGKTELARELVARNVEVLREIEEDPPLRLAAALVDRVRVCTNTFAMEGLIEWIDEAWAIYAAAKDVNPRRRFAAMYRRARAYLLVGRQAEGFGYLAELVDAQRKELGPNDMSRCYVLEDYGRQLVMSKQHEAGIAAMRESYEIAARQVGADSDMALALEANLASCLALSGHIAEARQRLERIFAELPGLLGEEHPDTVKRGVSLGVLLLRQRGLCGAGCPDAPARGSDQQDPPR
jgi:tetratricopeptide (TPR) repeat protein/predicted Ser/Thr protein kinase